MYIRVWAANPAAPIAIGLIFQVCSPRTACEALNSVVTFLSRELTYHVIAYKLVWKTVCQQLILFKRNSNQAAPHDLRPFQFQTNNNLKPTSSMMSFFLNGDDKENISNDDDKENIPPIRCKTVASSATVCPVKKRLKQADSNIKLILQATAVPVQQRCEDDDLLYLSDEFDKLGEDE